MGSALDRPCAYPFAVHPGIECRHHQEPFLGGMTKPRPGGGVGELTYGAGAGSCTDGRGGVDWVAVSSRITNTARSAESTFISWSRLTTPGLLSISAIRAWPTPSN